MGAELSRLLNQSSRFFDYFVPVGRNCNCRMVVLAGPNPFGPGHHRLRWGHEI